MVKGKTPEEFLQEIQAVEARKTSGRLKIFFGFAAGVGKTYAMLEAAHTAHKHNIDVVVGYIEPHARPETAALLEGLETLPVQEIQYNGIVLREFDVDAALARKPQLILVDELAHSNAPGCRHTKRYQDVQELLKNGIDVYTTVNVQHIESLNDIVASITGVMVRERIPDSVFDHADQVELIDIEPKALIERLDSGRVYREAQAQRAVENFFTLENLTALREIALRRCADRVNLLIESDRIRRRGGGGAGEHILVCLSSAPSNSTIVRTGARMAAAFKANFTALFVQTSHFAAMNEENKKRLRTNMRLAQQLGAKIETAYGDDIPAQIAEFARLSGVTKIVVGRSTTIRHSLFSKPNLIERLIQKAPSIDIHIIPDANVQRQKYREKKFQKKRFELSARDAGISIGILLVASAIGLLFDRLGFTDPNIITVYLLSVLIIAIATSHRIYGVVSSLISVLAFNFIFTEPRYSLNAYDSGYPLTFAVMFLASVFAGTLAQRLKNSAKQSAQAAFRTKMLFDTNQILQQETDRNAIAVATARQLTKLLSRDVIIYMVKDGELAKPWKFPAPGKEAIRDDCVSSSERAVAAWVLKNNKHAGATTNTLSNAKCLYLAIRVNETVYGVASIVIDGAPLDAFENSILLSILGECALALENEKNAREKVEAATLAKNEQLLANLLRAISHDLKTPLNSISNAASKLLASGSSIPEDLQRQLYGEIYNHSVWLINLVENLLSMSQLEDGRLRIRPSSEPLADIVADALCHINRISIDHNITVVHQDKCMLVKADPRLMAQVLINIIDNAIQYTPKGSDIRIETKRLDKYAQVTIADNGAGIPDEMKPHVFEMFYTRSHNIPDSRRGLGLGLSLCQSIITAHGGTITVEDNKPQGAAFRFTLPIDIKAPAGKDAS